jgi:hypothetical protein
MFCFPGLPLCPVNRRPYSLEIRLASFLIRLARPRCYLQWIACPGLPLCQSPCKRATDVSGGDTAALALRWSSPNEIGHPQDRDAVGKREKGLTEGCPSLLGGAVRCRSKVGA